MTVMTSSDRRATELYLTDLEREFGDATIVLFTARDLGDMDDYRVYSDKSAALYREITEVEAALRIGVLSF
jgi:hypothetical protein